MKSSWVSEDNRVIYSESDISHLDLWKEWRTFGLVDIRNMYGLPSRNRGMANVPNIIQMTRYRYDGKYEFLMHPTIKIDKTTGKIKGPAAEEAKNAYIIWLRIYDSMRRSLFNPLSAIRDTLEIDLERWAPQPQTRLQRLWRRLKSLLTFS